MFHKMNDDQAEVLESIEKGFYQELAPHNSESGTNYQTNSGIFFTWLHGLGDGKTVQIFKLAQPEWFAKKVREALKD